jgi:hypothetical protein
MVYTPVLTMAGCILARELIAAIKKPAVSTRTVRVSPVQPDPAVLARIRAYTALSMVERYGEHGP